MLKNNNWDLNYIKIIHACSFAVKLIWQHLGKNQVNEKYLQVYEIPDIKSFNDASWYDNFFVW